MKHLVSYVLGLVMVLHRQALLFLRLAPHKPYSSFHPVAGEFAPFDYRLTV